MSTSPINKCTACNGTGIQPDPRAVGAELKRRRLAAGLTLRQLALTVGCANSFLSELEHGTKWGDGRWAARVGETLDQIEENLLRAK